MCRRDSISGLLRLKKYHQHDNANKSLRIEMDRMTDLSACSGTTAGIATRYTPPSACSVSSAHASQGMPHTLCPAAMTEEEIVKDPEMAELLGHVLSRVQSILSINHEVLVVRQKSTTPPHITQLSKDAADSTLLLRCFCCCRCDLCDPSNFVWNSCPSTRYNNWFDLILDDIDMFLGRLVLQVIINLWTRDTPNDGSVFPDGWF